MTIIPQVKPVEQTGSTAKVVKALPLYKNVINLSKINALFLDIL